ncbi:MAG: hypothetical protein HY270_13790 [Deltaproteobacteria bacterium]|nr:hypothetical protein [Deltaproteobacteria bacterium]
MFLTCLLFLGCTAAARRVAAITATSSPTRTPTRTPGPSDCCQCDLEGQALCGVPVNGNCPSNCALHWNALCNSGNCTAFTGTPTPTVTTTPAPRPNCALLFPDGPTASRANRASGCSDNWECARDDDGDNSYVFLDGDSLGGTTALDLYALTDIAPRAAAVTEVNIHLRSRDAISRLGQAVAVAFGDGTGVVHIDSYVGLTPSYWDIVRHYPMNSLLGRDHPHFDRNSYSCTTDPAPHRHARRLCLSAVRPWLLPRDRFQDRCRRCVWTLSAAERLRGGLCGGRSGDRRRARTHGRDCARRP